MIATGDFLFLHLPKTGGSFVTHHLLGVFPDAEYFDRHGFRRQIPPAYRHLPLVGCLRCPYDWYVSGYEFRWWVKSTELFPGVENHPRYPDLTFEDYVHLGNGPWLAYHNPDLAGSPQVGWYTSALINWYGIDPDRFLAAAVECPPTVCDVRDQLGGVHLLRTARLNHDLCSYLRAYGVGEDKLSAIRTAPRIRPPDPEETRRTHSHWRDYYTPDLLSFVRHKERLAFELFPEFDVVR